MNENLMFRVWHTESKCYVSEYETQSGENKLKYFLNQDGTLGRLIYFLVEGECEDNIVNPEWYIIERCTGCKDKNGKYIYEGDIVNVARAHITSKETSKGCFTSECHEDGIELGFVLWIGERWSIAYKRYDDFDDMRNIPHRYEIVGNKNITPETVENFG